MELRLIYPSRRNVVVWYVWKYGVLNIGTWKGVCRENCESHEMCEIREGHVKSSKQFEGVELVGVPRRLSMKSLRIEQMVRHENGRPVVLTANKCSR